jgi:spore coat polysaccharide biosynthesis protein SpsF
LSGLPDGLGCQIFTTNALRNSYNSDVTELDKEHVTSHMKRNPEKFVSHYTETPPELCWPELSLSLDEKTDFEILSKIISELEPQDPLFGTTKIIDFFKAHPELLEKNLEIYRRGYE